jgi:hypothetical protein
VGDDGCYRLAQASQRQIRRFLHVLLQTQPITLPIFRGNFFEYNKNIMTVGKGAPKSKNRLSFFYTFEVAEFEKHISFCRFGLEMIENCKEINRQRPRKWFLMRRSQKLEMDYV